MRITVNGRVVDVPEGRSVSIKDGTVFVDGVAREEHKPEEGPAMRVEIKGDLPGGLTCDKNVTVVGHVYGNIDADGNVTCGGVGAGVNAKGGVACGNIGHGLDAGGEVNCRDVGGNVRCGGGIAAGKIMGTCRTKKG